MPAAAKEFIDYYQVLDCAPDASADELKKAYHKKLREFHPDKRQTIHGLGHKVSQMCNEAWEVLSSPRKREAYDKNWVRHQSKSMEGPSRQPEAPAQGARAEPGENGPKVDQAERYRHEGNELYKLAAEALKTCCTSDDKAPVLEQFQAALDKYSLGIELAPYDHRLLSNRALCYAALLDWHRCHIDALRVTQLNPDFMKGWFMLAKALWKQGFYGRALDELEKGLRLLPYCEDLLKLQSEFKKEMEADGGQRLPRIPSAHGRLPSRNPSPCQSRPASPPRRAKSTPPFFSAWQGFPADDAAQRGRPPPAPGSHRKSSRSPAGADAGADPTRPRRSKVSLAAAVASYEGVSSRTPSKE